MRDKGGSLTVLGEEGGGADIWRARRFRSFKICSKPPLPNALQVRNINIAASEPDWASDHGNWALIMFMLEDSSIPGSHPMVFSSEEEQVKDGVVSM